MTITETVSRYIESHPSVRDCMAKKLVNYSQLSRRIIADEELKKSDFEAVLIACRRHAERLAKAEAAEDEIARIIRKSTIDVKNRIAVAIIDKRVNYDDFLEVEKKARKHRGIFYAIEGTAAITLVVSHTLLEDIADAFGRLVLSVMEDLALATIQSPEEIETTPGSLAYLAGRLADNNVNIVEMMSCWSETLFVVNEKDVAALMDALSI